MVAEQHYDDEALLNLLRNRMTSDTHTVQSHLESCELCQDRLETVACNGMTWHEVSGLLKTEALTADLNHSDDSASDDDLQRHWDHSATKLLQPSDHPDSLGRFGRYEIMEVLGQGGMGVVMRGYDKALNRHSAIKVLAPELASSAAARRRFSREAKSAAAVVHSHVVPIHTVDAHDGLPYLVMPVVEGQSVDARVHQAGPLAIVEAVRIAAQIAAGLAAAHEQGLVHRDIKPANVLLENGVERVQITDFGLARAIDDASLTRSGVISGTPQYMSPEQSRGDAVDHRSDLFSLGSLMYFMLTGRSPFRAETTMGVLNRICNDAPRNLRTINPDVPEWLKQIVEKLLAKSTDDRFQNAQEVSELLENCLAHVQDPNGTALPSEVAELASAASNKPPSRRTFIATAAAALLFACMGLVLIELNKGTIKIESDFDGVPIRIMQGDEVIQQMTVHLDGNSTRIAAGTYIIEVDSKFDGLELSKQKCILSRGATETIRISYSDDSTKVTSPIMQPKIPPKVQPKTQLRVMAIIAPDDSAGYDQPTLAAGKAKHQPLFTEFDITDITSHNTESIVTDRSYLTFTLSDEAFRRCRSLVKKEPWIQVALELDGKIIGKPTLSLTTIELGLGLCNATLRDFEKITARKIASRVWQATPAAKISATVTNDQQSTPELHRLTEEYQRLSNEYQAALKAAQDSTERTRVYQEMDPREIMPAKYLAFEQDHRGTEMGLDALIKAAQLARSVGNSNSAAAKGRIIALQRILDHYLSRQGLEVAVESLSGGPRGPEIESFLETLVDKSPYPKAQAASLLVQIRNGLELLQAKAQLPEIMARYENDAEAVRREYEDQLKVLDELNVDQLRTDLNQKLAILADRFRSIPLPTYGTGSTAAKHLSHAINLVRTGMRAPELLATDIKGNPFQLSKLKGKITVLLFTQDFSGEYGEIYAGIRQLVAKYSQQPLQVVGVMSNNARSNLNDAEKRGKLPWVVIPQEFNGPIQLDWGIDGYPSVYIVDAQGILHAPIHMPYYGDGGYDTTDVVTKIDELLATDSSTKPSESHGTPELQAFDWDSSFASPAHAQTVTKLERVMKALHQYHDKHGHFPSSQMKGTNGQAKFPYSWRIAILPFLDERQLYDAYHFNEAWNSKHNLTLQAQMPDVFRSPLDTADSIHTSWTGFTSPQVDFDEKGSQQDRTFFHPSHGASMQNFTDGTSNTIGLVESKQPIPWTQPVDLGYVADQPLPQLGGWFSNGFHAAFVDGTADFVALYNSDSNLRNLLTIADGVPSEPILASRLIFRETQIDSEGNPVVDPTRSPILTEADVTSVKFTTATDDANYEQIEFRLTREAGKKLFRETTRLSNLQPAGHIAVELDGKLLSAPRVMSAISDRLVLTGVEIETTHLALKQIIQSANETK
ncbi:MAG: protein kinase [Fuerstiella sp.]